MSLELALDVAQYSRQIALVWSRDVVAPRPLHCSAYASIRSRRRHRLRQTHEITDPGIGAEAHEQMYVIRENLSLDQLHTGLFARAEDGDPYLRRRARVNTLHPIPGVPSDVRVHLECSVCRQGVLTPGASPGSKKGNRSPNLQPNLLRSVQKSEDHKRCWRPDLKPEPASGCKKPWACGFAPRGAKARGIAVALFCSRGSRACARGQETLNPAHKMGCLWNWRSMYRGTQRGVATVCRASL